MDQFQSGELVFSAIDSLKTLEAGSSMIIPYSFRVQIWHV